MIKAFAIFTVLSWCTACLFLNIDDISTYKYFYSVLKYYNFPSSTLLSYFQTNDLSKDKLFSKHELAEYSDDRLYLAILGKVFDVTKGKQYYGKGEGYNGFVGKDGSKAFITGDFTEEGLTDDLTGLSMSDLWSLKDWLKLYEKDYIYKGKLIGRFYDEEGEETDYLKDILRKVQEAEIEKQSAKTLENKYPPCNVEWDKDKGSRVWCSNQSGGVKRSWVGFPRKFFQPGNKHPRCACLKTSSSASTNRFGNFELYAGCDSESTSCFVNLK